MSIDALFPVAGEHAIQHAAFVIEWPAAFPLSKETLQAVTALHPEIRSVFPVVQEHKAVTINIDTNTPNAAPVPTFDELGGVHFIKPNPALGPAGVSRTIQINKHNIIVVIADYSRWDTVWGEVSAWLDMLLPFVLDGRPVSAMNLQYNDRFNWRGDPRRLDLSEVIRRDSKYVAPNIFEANNLWHSHHGFIEDRSAPIQHRLTDNINLNLTLENQQLGLQLFTSHRGELANAAWDFMSASEAVRTLMTDFHNRNKEILKNLFTEAVCNKINLA
ncbi:TIGR04255 family protein [Cupriavidus taiwanensis]|uniref:TIGR04255 family protein n=1 Tax=Cupriavidus taiwanensis TaxID=164546 RepID=UPI001574117E|nr:TIGR04255 family protein [Cupriavidus taiwanensis]NSX15960.1 TIGR04255 family protein [Cupriavidus taiwanensis]